MKRSIIFTAVAALIVGMLNTSALFALTSTNLIANESVETKTAVGEPTAWSKSKWGTNNASFQYKTDAHSGSRSLYASMTTRTTGEAKWTPGAANIQPNKEYTYTEWYKSSVSTKIDLRYTAVSGSVRYAYVKTLPASASWSQVTIKFVTPSDVAKVSPIHVLTKAGWLQTDDFSLTAEAPTTTPPVTPPVVEQDNLIANNSFEQAAVAESPDKWSKNAWGTNSATFKHETTGHTGSKSASVTVSSYTDGDAKWFADPTTVVAGKNYIYRDYYRSNVPTRVVVAFTDASNNTQYAELPEAPASQATWAQYSNTFTAPANASKATVYHLIDRVGNLTIDDATLSVALPTQTTQTVPNASVEAPLGTTDPLYWQRGSWGTNTSTYDYVNEGHTGTKSIKVTMSNYVNGDAKWFFNPINTLKPGSQYRFTAWYKGNVSPHPVAMFIMTDGSEQYFAMPVPQSTSTSAWQKYSDTFSVPAGAVSGSAFMYISQNGWLQTDDYSLEDYHPNGFSRPLLSMTFDDGHEENATNALPLLNQYGFKTTQCFATSFIEGQSQAVINGVLAFKNSGHEICSHTVTHPFLTTMTTSAVDYELQHSKQYLEKIVGTPVVNFASPYGDYNPSVVTEIKKFYNSHRSVDEGFNSKDNFNIYNLRVQNVLDTTSAAQITSWIKQAQTDKTWLILVYHRIASDPGPYDSYTNVFTEHLKAIKASGITVNTLQAALAEVTPQTK